MLTIHLAIVLVGFYGIIKIREIFSHDSDIDRK